CAVGSYCDTTNNGGTCSPEKPPAAPCTAGDQCATGNCVDGVCCDHACNGTCEGCVLAHTGQADGTCAPYKPGTTAPAGQCSTGTTCGNDGKCAAGGACEQAPSTTMCGTSTCVSTTGQPGSLSLTGLCSGSGTCVPGAGVPCPGNLPCAS